MREESPDVHGTGMRIDPEQLPDTPYNLWIRDELDDYLEVPEGHRVEIIGGEVVVSPAPSFQHNTIAGDINRAFVGAAVLRTDFPWMTDQGTAITPLGIEEGYEPDLLVMERGIYESARRVPIPKLVPDQVELVVEITSPRNADRDRRSDKGRRTTKWNAYASAEIPYYLLVDRDPKIASTTLFTIPDQGSGAYLYAETWEFGETLHLPDPFDLDIDTSDWFSWKG